MENDGFTGFNPELAKKNIQDYNEEVLNLIIALRQGFGYLFSELKYKWCSPKAVHFANEFIPKICQCDIDITTANYNIMLNAKEAYNLMARANGSGLIVLDEDIVSSDAHPIESNVNGREEFLASYGILPLEPSHPINGGVGMNIQLVKSVIHEFELKMVNALDSLRSLPTEIALFDAENAQQYAYKSTINRFVDRYEHLFGEILDAIKNDIELEQDNILLAKKQATESLNG